MVGDLGEAESSGEGVAVESCDGVHGEGEDTLHEGVVIVLPRKGVSSSLSLVERGTHLEKSRALGDELEVEPVREELVLDALSSEDQRCLLVPLLKVAAEGELNVVERGDELPASRVSAVSSLLDQLKGGTYGVLDKVLAEGKRSARESWSSRSSAIGAPRRTRRRRLERRVLGKTHRTESIIGEVRHGKQPDTLCWTSNEGLGAD